MVTFSKDYDVEMVYHLGKTNMVGDALSRKSPRTSTLITNHDHDRDMEHVEVAMFVTTQFA